MHQSNDKQSQLIQAIILAPLMCFAAGFAIAGPSGIDAQLADIGEVPLLAVGPISSIDSEIGSVTVNGQVFLIDDQTSVYLQSNLLHSQDYVAVYGEAIDPGLGLATIIEEISDDYVAGASDAYLQVIVEANDASTANALSGQTAIDYTAALTDADLQNIASGDLVEFFGTAYGAEFYATEGRAVETGQFEIATANFSAAPGGGVRGIRGGGVRGIRGGGVRGIRGGGVRSIDQAREN